MIHPEFLDFNVTFQNKTLFDVHINFPRDLSLVYLDLLVLHDSGDANYDMVYMNKTVDFCHFLTNRKSNIFFEIAYRRMADYADLPKRCPVRKVTNFISNFLNYFPGESFHISRKFTIYSAFP